MYTSWSGSSSKVFVPIASLLLLRILCSVPGAVKILLLVQIQNSSERGAQLQSLVSSPSQNRLLPALSMGCLLPLLHSFHPEGLLTCKSGPRGGHLPVLSAPWALRQEDLKHHAHPDYTVRPFLKNSGKRRLADSFCQATLSFLQQPSHEHTNPRLLGFLLHVQFSLSKYSPLFFTLPSPLSSS